jgi:hypothetical protein
MANLQHILDSVHALSQQEKLTLRNVLDCELKSQPSENGAKPKSQLIGLFSNESEMLDEVMESVYEGRRTGLLHAADEAKAVIPCDSISPSAICSG